MTTHGSRSPLDRLRRMTLATWSVGLVAIGGAVLWSVVGGAVEPRLPDPRIAPSETLASVGRPIEPLRQDAFAGRLSPAPPPASVTEAPKDTSRSGSLELVAISRVGEEFVAAIYDNGEKRLHLVRSGERIGPVAVTKVESREVVLAEGTATRSLRLMPPKPRNGGEPLGLGGGA